MAAVKPTTLERKVLRHNMNITATHRVKDSQGKTVGFVIDHEYRHYYDVLRNIALIDNLTLDESGEIVWGDEELPVRYIADINTGIYDRICGENPLERDVQRKLEKWLAHWSGYVLYVTGARQTGKTTEILKFAYKHYEQIIYVNLADQKQLEELERSVENTSLYFGLIDYCRKSGNSEFDNSQRTILIIDEIQESSKIYNSIRALQRELKCHIAVTGSYLGKILNARYFKPAGNMYEIEMLPLSFREFSRAYDLEGLLMKIDLFGKSADEEYGALTRIYRIYRKIGGYPAVVSTYRKTSDMDSCREVIKSIIERFTEESVSYFRDTKCAVVFENVYKAAFISMTKEKRGTSARDIRDITEFIREDTNEHVSRKEVNDAISWLKFSGILGSCDWYNQGKATDLLSERRFYFMDCGIANYLAVLTPIQNRAVEGIIAENFVYSELYRLYRENKLKGDKPCCSVYGNYELDFMLVDKDDKRYGIEVKSNNSDKHKSLDLYLEKELIHEAYVAEITRGGTGKKIRRIPIYTVGCRFPYQ